MPAPQASAAASPTSANVGFLLADLDSGQILEHARDTELFIPASVSKVPSTLAALHILGHEFRFLTSLRTNGQVANGVLQGDLYLVGSGDPSFSMANLMDLVLQLRNHGVKRVQGRFVYDESALLPAANISEEQSEEETYNQGVSALTLDFNRVRLQWAGTKKSGGLAYSVTPDFGYIQIQPAPAGQNGLDYVGGDGIEQWRLGGVRNGSEWLPIKNPGRYFASALREFARRIGVEIPGPVAGKTPVEARLVLAEHRSPTLDLLVDQTLEHSNNLWTELIAMTAAGHLAGKPQSIGDAATIVTDWMRRKMPEVDWNGFKLGNSCGLTATSRVSPRQMVEILRFANQARAGERTFASLLPISGWKGTLANRMSGPNAFRVWAKTGVIHYGRGLAGFALTRTGRRLVFAVFVSDFERRKEFDARTNAHSANEIRQAKEWNGRAGELIFNRVEDWIRQY
ncbi:MAG: D-alanyl-D-alanine carboxypeptidase/D-alanyl-D-alanine-endopeptidase [Magnetococcales bacterium]|nr:D-alanyl-D-alanine carboxypeptidase/D-alanyl-D-alanine-endopeptidase [Magnetococcales bacterium]